MGKQNHFHIKDNKMLFWRLGNINSNIQKHWKQEDTRQPPVRRGLWCFPYPHYDFFFCYHQWEARLPKKFRHLIGEERDNSIFDKMTLEEAETYHNEKEERIKKIRKEFRPKQFWYGGKFYSHIFPDNQISSLEWYLWDSVKDWAKLANKTLVAFERHEPTGRNNGNKLYTVKYVKDHLEIFIPNY